MEKLQHGFGVEKRSSPDSSGGCIRGVSLDMVGVGVIREYKNRCRGDQLLEFVERGLLRFSPLPSDIFLSEVKEGMRMVREVLDEPSVEVYESDKGLDFPFLPRLWPF